MQRVAIGLSFDTGSHAIFLKSCRRRRRRNRSGRGGSGGSGGSGAAGAFAVGGTGAAGSTGALEAAAELEVFAAGGATGRPRMS